MAAPTRRARLARAGALLLEAVALFRAYSFPACGPETPATNGRRNPRIARL